MERQAVTELVAEDMRQERRCRERASEPAAAAELRMEQRGVTEVELRAMRERATDFDSSVVEGRFMIRARGGRYPVSMTLIIAACPGAAWIPASRAARLDPMKMLRQE